VIKIGFNIFGLFETKKDPIEYKKDDLRSILNKIDRKLSEKFSGTMLLFDRRFFWKIYNEQRHSFYDQITESDKEIFRIRLTKDGLNGKELLHYNIFDSKYEQIFNEYFEKNKEFCFERDKSIIQT